MDPRKLDKCSKKCRQKLNIKQSTGISEAKLYMLHKCIEECPTMPDEPVYFPTQKFDINAYHREMAAGRRKWNKIALVFFILFMIFLVVTIILVVMRNRRNTSPASKGRYRAGIITTSVFAALFFFAVIGSFVKKREF